MKALRLRGVVGALLVVCSASGARADIGTEIARSCVAEWFLPQEVCSCVAEQALGRFNEVQLNWLALPAGFPAEAASLAKAMTMSQALAISNFMVSVPHQCGAP
ncbi:MAG: hypothetical protein WEB63_00200 [Cucumibacter sp.]